MSGRRHFQKNPSAVGMHAEWRTLCGLEKPGASSVLVQAAGEGTGPAGGQPGENAITFKDLRPETPETPPSDVSLDLECIM